MSYVTDILEQYEEFIEEPRLLNLKRKVVYFALEKDVLENGTKISKANLFESKEMESYLKDKFNGQSWIRAELVKTFKDGYIILISLGPITNLPTPNIITSLNRDVTVEII